MREISFSGKMAKNHALSMVCILVMLFMLLNPLLSLAAVTRSLSYSPFSSYQGVIESDRFDYMDADGNPLKEDTANYVFQGVGALGSETTGYMKDVYLTITKWGTITQLNYTGENRPGFEDGNRPLDGNGKYHWLPVIEQDPPPTPAGTLTPLEGWAIAYNVTPKGLAYNPESGYLVVTFSGYRVSPYRLVASVMGMEENDDWVLTLVDREVWVDNPRLLAVFYNISAVNQEYYSPKFELDMVIVFNKATKFVEVFMKLKLVDIYLGACEAARVDFALARMAIFDANPYCDKAFYGWKNVTVEDPTFFMVLSWTNETLADFVGVDEGYDYYACYMAAYPVPDSWAIGSTWADSPDADNLPEAFNIWNAPMLKTTYYNASNNMIYLDKYVWLDMEYGDQALVRVEWYGMAEGTPKMIRGATTDWKMVMYGVYDVNGTSYDGGEGGNFTYGYALLSDRTKLGNSTVPNKPVTNWNHTGTLGWLNGKVSNESLKGSEDNLTKTVRRIDLDQNGTINAGEENITASWWPTEELYWQLHFKFAPPVFKKYDTTCCFFRDGIIGAEQFELPEHGMWDFTVLPAPGATTDAAGAAWLTARFTSLLVLFDVEAYNMTATVGYTNPDLKMLPYLMLRLGEASKTVEGYAARRSRYLTSDKRALPQMEFEDRETTLWRDVHYLLVTVAGVRPNLATYYFNDFTQIPFALGGDRANSYVVLPYGGPVDITPYSGSKKTMGLAVIALARDHFNNIALVVTATDSQDTYWSAWFATWNWSDIRGLDNWSAVMYEIDYTAITNNWGDGDGIPIAHPNYPLVNGEPAFILVANATEYACEPGL